MNGSTMPPGEPNPYQPPHEPAEPPAPQLGHRDVVPMSIFMIISGAFFCVASFYVLLGQGIDSFLASYRSVGRFPLAFMIFYGCAGGLTSLFHLSYLIRGWPKQHLAGVYAIVLALGLTGLAMAIML
jgi:hypothetical protein